MKKIKKLIIIIIFLILFSLLHLYTEKKFDTDPPKGMTERIKEWTNDH